MTSAGESSCQKHRESFISFTCVLFLSPQLSFFVLEEVKGINIYFSSIYSNDGCFPGTDNGQISHFVDYHGEIHEHEMQLLNRCFFDTLNTFIWQYI